MADQITAFQILETLQQAREYTSTNNELTSRGIAEVDNLLIGLQDKLHTAFGSDSQTAPLKSMQEHPGKPQPEGPFQIMINDYQRQLINRVIAITLAGPNFTMIFRNEPGDQVYDTKLDELVALLEMFEGLPKDNTEGMTHGFCL